MATKEELQRIYDAGAKNGIRAAREREPAPSGMKFDPDYPLFRQVARSGATRYAPELPGDHKGRVVIHWFDSITLEEYDEMRLDGQIKAGMMLVKLPVQQANWTITCSDPDIQAFIAQVLRPIWPVFIRQALTALDFGYSVFEKLWEVQYNLAITQTQSTGDAMKERTYPHALVLQDLMQLDPVLLRLLAYRRSAKFAGVQFYIPDAGILDSKKAFLFTYDEEFKELQGVSRQKACYPYWYMKKLQYEFMMTAYELASIPARKGFHPEGGQEKGLDGNGNPIIETNSDTMLEIIQGIRNNHAISLPSKRYGDDGSGERLWDVEYLENPVSPDSFLPGIDHQNLMILKSLLVPQLALETGSSGTYNLAEEQIDFFMLGEAALMDQVGMAINTQIIPQLVRYNFGPRAPMALIEFQPLTKSVREALTNVFMETIGQGQPIPLKDGSQMVPDWQQMADWLGIPVNVLTEEEAATYSDMAHKNAGTGPYAPQPDPNDPNGEGGVPPDDGSGGQFQADMSEDGIWVVSGGKLVWKPIAHAS